MTHAPETPDYAGSQMTAPAREGELSVREKATEVEPGVYVTQQRTFPITIGRSAIANRQRAREARRALTEKVDGQVEE